MPNASFDLSSPKGAKNQQEIADILPNGGRNSVPFSLRSFLGESNRDRKRGLKSFRITVLVLLVILSIRELALTNVGLWRSPCAISPLRATIPFSSLSP